MYLPDELITQILDSVIRQLNGQSFVHIALVSQQFNRCVQSIAYHSIVLEASSLTTLEDTIVHERTQHLVLVTDELTHTITEKINACLLSCQNLQSLRFYGEYPHIYFIPEYWSDFIQHFTIRPTRLAMEVELSAMVQVLGWDSTPGFISNLTHLELNHFEHSKFFSVLNFPHLTHLLVSTTWARHAHLLRYINTVLPVFKSSPLKLFVLIMHDADVPSWDKCIGRNARDVGTMRDMTSPDVVLADLYSAWQAIEPNMLLENVRHYLDDVREHPYPTVPDIWEQAEELVRRRRAGPSH